MQQQYDNLDNLLTLQLITEENILNVLYQRYLHHKIYTNSGNLLLAVNPYQYLEALYDDQIFLQYSQFHGQYDDIYKKLSPHPWKIALTAYENLYSDFKDDSLSINRMKKLHNQSILISGESGAGKTETTKYLMSYLARRGNSITPGNEDSLGPVQRKVLQTNPILDALGNARTIRNDNSSRFGKYIKLLYNIHGELLGSSLDTFLLEATRVVHQNPNERNFHIFYLICTENNAELRARYKIKAPQTYHYLTASGGCFDRRDGVEDSDTYQHFLQSFSILEGLNLSSSDEHICKQSNNIDGLIRAIMAVLTIGNTQFSSYLNSSGDVVMNIDQIFMKFVDDTSDLLSLDKDLLLRAITTKSVTINGEDFLSTLDQEHATQMRDVFAKTLYRTIFEWTIEHLNHVLSTSSSDSQKEASAHDPQGIIGILDIFGFEIFSVNSLEQLLINYCNENLQQQYDKFMIEKEQLLYVHEGIQWNFVEFPSAQETISLISGVGSKKKTDYSILGFLDEACIAPSGSDASFIRQIYSHLDKHDRISLTSLNKAKSEFGIHHYAGLVTYNAKDFVTKNKTFFFPLDDLLKSSKHSYFQLLEKIASRMISAKVPTASQHPEVSEHHHHTGSHHGHHHKRRLSVMQVSTIASSFVSNVESLLNTIASTHSHYIKCFKPNTLQVKENFDQPYLLEQLKCGGVVHSLKVVRAGFPIRYSYKEFWEAYYPLMVVLIREAMNGEIPPDVKIQILPHEESTDSFNEEENLLILGISQGIDIVIQRVQLAVLSGEIVLEESMKVPNEDLSLCIQRGKTVIFFRTSGFHLLSLVQNKMLGHCATLIQAHYRRCYQRKIYVRFLKSIFSLQRKYYIWIGLQSWRKKIMTLKRFFRKCKLIARRYIKMRQVARTIVMLFRRRKIIKKWRPILRLLARFVRKAVVHIRRKCSGRLLANRLLPIYRKWKVYQQWNKIIRAFRLFVSRCKVYAKRTIAAKMEKAARLILRILRVRILKIRVKRANKMARRLQRWVRYGSFRKYLMRKYYLQQLFTGPAIKLQRMWRWKSRVYSSIQKEREKQRNRLHEISLTSTAPSENRKSLGKESLLHHYTHVDSAETKEVSAKLLLHSNKNTLWTVLSYYCDNKHCSIPAGDKKYQVGVVSDRGIIKLLRDWGIIPMILPFQICQQVIQDRLTENMEQSGRNRQNGYFSYNQFCRILLFLSAEIIQKPEPPSLNAQRTRPVMSIRLADAIFLNPLGMPMIGTGLRWLLTIMDRSEGRNKFTHLRSTVVIPAFHGVLGSQLHINVQPVTPSPKVKQYASNHRYRLGNIKTGPMSADVQALVKRNEPILVSMTLRYSGKDYRSSYYGRIEIPSTPNLKNRSSGGDDDFNDDENSSTKYRASSAVRATMIKRDQMRREAVGLTFDGLWNMMNDFGVCPEHCSKSTLREICEVAMSDSPFPREDGFYGYEDVIEILNLVAQNSYNTRSEFGTTEDRMSNLFSSMNKSGGRQRLIDVDRNALVIPPLYLSLKEPNSLSRGASGLFNVGTTSFASSSSRRSVTPPPTSRRSQTPPAPLRAKTPPPTKRSSLQSNTRSKTPPATTRNMNKDTRPISYDGRRLSAPSSIRKGEITTEHDPSLLPNGRGSRIPIFSPNAPDTPSKFKSLSTVSQNNTPSPDISAHRLSLGRRSGIPQRLSTTTGPSTITANSPLQTATPSPKSASGYRK